MRLHARTQTQHKGDCYCPTLRSAALPAPLVLFLGLAALLGPALLVEQRAVAPGEFLGADVHVAVLGPLVVVLMRVRQVPRGHADAQRDGCAPRAHGVSACTCLRRQGVRAFPHPAVRMLTQCP